MQGGRWVGGWVEGKSRTRAGSIECPPRHSASVQSIQTMDLNSSVASLQGGGGAYTGPLIAKVDIRVGKIVKVRYQSPDVGHSDPFDHGSYVRARMIHSFVRAQAWPHPDSDKLWCEEIDVGEVRSLSRCFGGGGGHADQQTLRTQLLRITVARTLCRKRRAKSPLDCASITPRCGAHPLTRSST